MNEQTDRPHERIGKKSRRYRSSGKLGQQQAKKLEPYLRVELGFAVRARTEHIGLFDDAQSAFGGDDDVEKNLESLGRQRSRQRIETIAPHHEEATHWIGQLDMSPESREGGGGATHDAAASGKGVGASAFDVAAAYHPIGFAPLEPGQHAPPPIFLLLENRCP